VRLGKAARLLRRGEFLAVQDRGTRLAGKEYAVLALESVQAWPRLGVTVSSKVANAVVRNRIKRWVREAYREVAGELPPVDLLVIARKGAARAGLGGARHALAEARRAMARAEGRP
jgi:ribonuclease P protein component